MTVMSEASARSETARGRGGLRLGLASPAEARRERWERLAAVPLALAAIAFLAAYAVPIIWPGVDRTLQRVCTVVVQVVWLALLVDYVVRFVLARSKRSFVVRHLLDLVVLALPMVRQLQLLRLVVLFSILDRMGVRTFRGRVLTYAVAASALSFLIASLALTSTERGVPGATIENFGDGMWFSIATLTTVGYGDMYPVTTQGRVIAAALMMVGLVLFGTVTGTLASYVVSKVSGESTRLREAAAATSGRAGPATARPRAPRSAMSTPRPTPMPRPTPRRTFSCAPGAPPGGTADDGVPSRACWPPARTSPWCGSRRSRSSPSSVACTPPWR